MNEALEGCGGRLCRLLHWSAVKFDCKRCDEGDFGQLEPDNVLLEYSLCGKIGVKFGSGGTKNDIPGNLGRRSTSLILTVIASSEPPCEGDIISDNNEVFRIISRISSQPECFALEKIGEAV